MDPRNPLSANPTNGEARLLRIKAEGEGPSAAAVETLFEQIASEFGGWNYYVGAVQQVIEMTETPPDNLAPRWFKGRTTYVFDLSRNLNVSDPAAPE